MSLPSPRTLVTHLLASLPQPAPHASADTTTATPNNPLNGAPDSVKKQLLALHVLFPTEFLPALDLLDRGLVTRFRIRRLPKDPNPQEAAPSHTLRGPPESENTTAAPNETSASPSIQDIAPRPAQADEHPRLLRISEREGATIPRDRTPPALPQRQAAERGEDKEEMDTVYYVRSASHRSSSSSSSRFSVSSVDTLSHYEVRLRAWSCSCPAFAFNAFPSVHPEPGVPALDAHDDLGYVAPENGAAFGGLTLGAGMPPVCKHMLACVLGEQCAVFAGYVREREVSVGEAAGWAAGWGD
ncbi:hypothetical protein EJ04DRAFT_564454 [Polyplosphaeria fusca]|uniref:SWIM-type domain-containing protein n=1 Tax=Polyplosphaeria fusca TaxID=682080 RepID=A0A9P4QZZ6_9PLEO|nr:hypothetical protein EJ04DRAFT_564454 [Polyplosphaeria fusca]